MCDKQIINDLLSNIVCFGGNTMFSGFQDRLTAELSSLKPPNTRVTVKKLFLF